MAQRLLSVLVICVQLISGFPVIGSGNVGAVDPSETAADIVLEQNKDSAVKTTLTNTPSNTVTDTPTNTATGDSAGTPTDAVTGAPTDAATDTPTNTATGDSAGTPTDAVTGVPTDAVTDAPTHTATGDTAGTPTDTVTDAPTDVPTDAPTHTATGDTSGTPTDTPTDAPTNTATSTTTDKPTSKPTDAPTPELFGRDACFRVSLTRRPTGAGEPAEAVVVLKRLVGGSWDEVADPARPQEDYTATFTVSANGSGSADFVMTGLPVAAYRARLISYGGVSVDSDDRGYTVSYHDGEDAELTTDITVRFTSDTDAKPTDGITDATTDEPTEKPKDEPTDTPTDEPTETPTGEVTDTPTDEPTDATTDEPTDTPSDEPTETPTGEVTDTPSDEPTELADELSTENSLLLTSTALSVMSLSADAPMPLADEPPASKTLTISLTFNGTDYSIPISYTLTDSPTSSNIHCEPSSAAASTVVESTDGASATILVTPNTTTLASLGFTMTVVVNTNDTYSISINMPTGSSYRAIDDASVSGSLTEGEATAYLSAVELRSFVGILNWNDNKYRGRPEVESVNVVLQQSTDNGTNWTDVTGAPTGIHENKSYNEDSFIYSALDKYVESNEIKYRLRVIEDVSVSGYIIEHIMPLGQDVRLTLKTDIEITKEWNDIDAPEGMRPSMDAWLGLNSETGVRLSNGTGSVDFGGSSRYPYSLTADPDTCNIWKLKVTGLPVFSSVGERYTYSFTDSVSETLFGDNGDHYTNTARNIDEFADRKTAAYRGGALVSTVAATDEFIFTKKWVDGETADTDRPTVIFYMYRFAKDSGYDYSGASPVSGMDNMRLENSETEKVITYTGKDGNTVLPRYDEQGREYVYFLTESIVNNNRNYVTTVTDAELTTIDHILNGSIVTNKSSAIVNPSATKTWKARSVQGMDAAVTLQLYSQISEADTPVAVHGATREIPDFIAERMTQTQTFTEQPMYNEQGYKYIYTVREIGASVDGDTVNAGTDEDGNPLAYAEGAVFTADGYDFKVSYGPGNLVTNTLVGSTKLRITKVWSPELTDPTQGEIKVKLSQTVENVKTLFTDYDDVSYPNNVTVDTTTGEATIQGTADGIDVVFSGLPRFD